MSEMPDILARICEAKREEIQRLKKRDSRGLADAASVQQPPRGFRDALLAQEGVSLIAEVKKASPSAGIIRSDFDPVEIAQAYERAGAACVSVLTDREFFQGAPDFLSRIRQRVELPLLRKDFILEETQITEARALGAVEHGVHRDFASGDVIIRRCLRSVPPAVPDRGPVFILPAFQRLFRSELHRIPCEEGEPRC